MSARKRDRRVAGLWLLGGDGPCRDAVQEEVKRLRRYANGPLDITTDEAAHRLANLLNEGGGE